MNFLKSAYSAYEQSQEGQQNNQNSQQQQQSNSPYPQTGGNNPYEQDNSYSSSSNQSPYPQSNAQGHYGSGGGEFGMQGSAALNSADNNRPSGGASSFLSQFLNKDEAVNTASNQSNEDSGLFAQAMSFLQDKGDDDDDIDEQQAQQAHQQAYGQGNSSNLGSKDLGSAAALQALKSFIGGSGGQQQQQQNSGGGFQTQLIGQAMSQAAKLFDQNGGAADGGNKQDVVNMAAKMMMKLLLKNQASGMIGGGTGSGGGMGQLMGLASKFM
ncbi:hypothetical protein JCM8547_003343 [Rhodosporidiobolus lusitaniae]